MLFDKIQGVLLVTIALLGQERATADGVTLMKDQSTKRQLFKYNMADYISESELRQI